MNSKVLQIVKLKKKEKNICLKTGVWPTHCMQKFGRMTTFLDKPFLPIYVVLKSFVIYELGAEFWCHSVYTSRFSAGKINAAKEHAKNKHIKNVQFFMPIPRMLTKICIIEVYLLK